MALTRKALKAMGCTDEQVDTIAEEHGEMVKALKDEIATLKEKYADYDEIKAERDELKNSGDNFKEKYEKEHQEFEDYKKSIAEKDERATKEAVAKEFFEEKGITGANLAIAMMGAHKEIADLKVKDGKIVDSTALDALVSGTFAGLVATKETRGAKMANPPSTNGGKTITKSDIFKIKDTAERQRAIMENQQLFNK